MYVLGVLKLVFIDSSNQCPLSLQNKTHHMKHSLIVSQDNLPHISAGDGAGKSFQNL